MNFVKYDQLPIPQSFKDKKGNLWQLNEYLVTPTYGSLIVGVPNRKLNIRVVAFLREKGIKVFKARPILKLKKTDLKYENATPSQRWHLKAIKAVDTERIELLPPICVIGRYFLSSDFDDVSRIKVVMGFC